MSGTSATNTAVFRFTTAIREFAAVIRQLTPHMQQLADAFRRFDERQRHGERNFTAAGAWQSDLCGAWVHDACPLPGHCDCTCHGGTLR